jgi:hypothetical protein
VFAPTWGWAPRSSRIRPDGSDLHQLTELDGNATHPDWSPDGTRIAFLLEDQGIYVMNADGSDLHQVVTAGRNALVHARRTALVYECSLNCDGGADGILPDARRRFGRAGRAAIDEPFVDNGDSDPQVSPTVER